MKKPTSINRPPLEASKVSVILLAAGHGKRMSPLTNTVPKPLLKVGDHALIEHHLYKLGSLGFKNIIINTAYLGEKIQQHLGNGERYGVDIKYSDESTTGALETAGGIKKSLSLINSDPFMVINADVYTDFNFASLLDTNLVELATAEKEPRKLGCLVLVENPKHNTLGDFKVDGAGQFDSQSTDSMTFSGIAVYRKKMFNDLPAGKLALGPIFKQLISQDKLCAMPFYGAWTDVGTPARLALLNTAKK